MVLFLYRRLQLLGAFSCLILVSPSLLGCEFEEKPKFIEQVVAALFSEDEGVYLAYFPEGIGALREFCDEFNNDSIVEVMLKLWQGYYGPRSFKVLRIVGSTGEFNSLVLNFFDQGIKFPPDFDFRQRDFCFGVGKLRTMEVEEFELPVFETDSKGRQIIIFQDEKLAKCIESKVIPELKLIKAFIGGEVALDSIGENAFSTEFSQRVWSAVLTKLAEGDEDGLDAAVRGTESQVP